MAVEDIKGVGAKTADKLKEKGITTVKSLAKSRKQTLTDEVGLGGGTADKILQNAREELRTHGTGYTRGDTLADKRNKLKKIDTGSIGVNKILGGGIPTGYITELYGKFGTGKSQIAMQLAVNTQKPVDEGGLGKKSIYIDTEHSYLPSRLEEIAKHSGVDTDKVHENVFISQPIDSDHLSEVVKNAKSLCANEDIGLIIVDSIIAPFRSDYTGRDELPERQNHMGSVITDLKQLIRTHDVAVVYTNQVMDNPDGNPYTQDVKPLGGNVLAHNSAFRIKLENRQSKGFAARLEDSPGLPPQTKRFRIDESGISTHDEDR